MKMSYLRATIELYVYVSALSIKTKTARWVMIYHIFIIYSTPPSVSSCDGDFRKSPP